MTVEFIGDAALFPTAMSESILGNERMKKNLYVFRLSAWAGGWQNLLVKKCTSKEAAFIKILGVFEMVSMQEQGWCYDAFPPQKCLRRMM